MNTQTDVHAHRHTVGHEYSIVVLDKPQVYSLEKKPLTFILATLGCFFACLCGSVSFPHLGFASFTLYLNLECCIIEAVKRNRCPKPLFWLH